MVRKLVERTLNQAAISYLNERQVDNTKCCFGSICHRGHEFQQSGYSIRWYSNRTCIDCAAEHVLREQVEHPERQKARYKKYYYSHREEILDRQNRRRREANG